MGIFRFVVYSSSILCYARTVTGSEVVKTLSVPDYNRRYARGIFDEHKCRCSSLPLRDIRYEVTSRPPAMTDAGTIKVMQYKCSLECKSNSDCESYGVSANKRNYTCSLWNKPCVKQNGEGGCIGSLDHSIRSINVPVNCAWGSWGEWSKPRCGESRKVRNRSISEEQKFGGTECNGQDATEEKEVEVTPCPVDKITEKEHVATTTPPNAPTTTTKVTSGATIITVESPSEVESKGPTDPANSSAGFSLFGLSLGASIALIAVASLAVGVTCRSCLGWMCASKKNDSGMV